MNVRFVLAPQAALDLVEFGVTSKNRPVSQSRTALNPPSGGIEFLAGTPGAGHSRKDLTAEDVKFFPVYSYLIVYRPHTTPLQVAAILHGRRDVEQILKGRI